MMFGMLLIIPALVIIVALIAYLLIWKTNKTSTEIMLFGLSIMLLGGIFAIDANSSFAGFEYIIVLLGFGMTVVGFIKRNQ